MAQQIAWGTITLHLDNEEFRKGFELGRQMYFDDIEYEHPSRMLQMTSKDMADIVADPEDDGRYHFDDIALAGPLDILGSFLGYMSGPLLPETEEERQKRNACVVVLQET